MSTMNLGTTRWFTNLDHGVEKPLYKDYEVIGLINIPRIDGKNLFKRVLIRRRRQLHTVGIESQWYTNIGRTQHDSNA